MSQPQLALFFTFLRLLRYPQKQFKALTQRRLDFYYRQVLRLAEKAAVPDRAHVIFTLAPNQTDTVLTKGTRLSAGADRQGKALEYQVDNNLYLTQTQVASVKTLSVAKVYIGLKDIHLADQRTNAAFENVLRWAVGTPNQGDPLPALPATDSLFTQTNRTDQNTFPEIVALFQAIKDLTQDNITPARQNYIQTQLFFATLDDFIFCFEVHTREINKNQPDVIPPTEAEWQQVYQLIEKAYRKKINSERRNRLKQEHQKYENAATAFNKLWQLALGDPAPRNLLPPFLQQPVNLDTLLTALGGPEAESVAATRYVQTQLFLYVADFQKIMAVKTAETQNWEEVYRLLEQAQTRKRQFTYPPIGRTEVKTIDAKANADAKPQQPLTLPRFHPFIALPLAQGKADGQAGKKAGVQSLGVAIASPVLTLGEGKRKITLTLACQADTFNQSLLTGLPQGASPFAVAISSKTGWLPIQLLIFKMGDFSLEPPLKTYQQTDLSLVAPTRIEFQPQKVTSDDIGTFILWVTGEIYKLDKLDGPNTVTVTRIGRIERTSTAEPKVEQYAATGIYLNALQFEFSLDAAQPAITAPSGQAGNTQAGAIHFQTSHPIITINLKDLPEQRGQPSSYQLFKGFCLEKAHVQVTVEDVQTLQLRNDLTVLNPKSPFEPFDTQPVAGAALYFSHPEIVAKKLDTLSLNLEWMGLPDSFAEHYFAYSRCGLSPQPPEIDNTSFQVQLDLLLNRSWHKIGTRSLFKTITKDRKTKLLSSRTLQYEKAQFVEIPAAAFTVIPTEPDTDDLWEHSRYFRLELTGPDFQHTLYPLVLNKVARAKDSDYVKDKNNNYLNKDGTPLTAPDGQIPAEAVKIQDLSVYPPYTPKIKGVSLNYQASAEINLRAGNQASQGAGGKIFQLHPFGYVDLQQTAKPGDPASRYFLLPQYDTEGSLFIGLRDVKPPQSLTLLFQLVSGSGNADLTPPTIQWSYLAGDRWRPFQPVDVLSDSTNGLVDSGIMRLNIPAAATHQNHLLPTGLHWLRATVTQHAATIPDVLAIRTQAATATFVNQQNDPEHLSQPLAAWSIQALTEDNVAIATVEQPYSSFGGRRQESHRTFYTRVSEQLRHKRRAITRWDYERLVLEQFPQIYKVKCLTQAEQAHAPNAALVTVVVIPNLANTAPFLPLEPKAPQYLLKQIEAYLQAHTSPFVKLVVKNPRYEQIKYRIGVRFRESYEQGHYLKQLNAELVRFLSPWAYEEQSDISFGSSIHSSTVIHFIETRPYVDYVTNLSLHEQVTANVRSSASDPNLAEVKQVDSILVSAPEHIIDVITTSDYQEEAFEGIGYMIIGVDFQVTDFEVT